LRLDYSPQVGFCPLVRVGPTHLALTRPTRGSGSALAPSPLLKHTFSNKPRFLILAGQAAELPPKDRRKNSFTLADRQMWRHALVRAASTLVSTPRGRCATAATAKLLLREP
jgi:hypothetical protein